MIWLRAVPQIQWTNRRVGVAANKVWANAIITKLWPKKGAAFNSLSASKEIRWLWTRAGNRIKGEYCLVAFPLTDVECKTNRGVSSRGRKRRTRTVVVVRMPSRDIVIHFFGREQNNLLMHSRRENDGNFVSPVRYDVPVGFALGAGLCPQNVLPGKFDWQWKISL